MRADGAHTPWSVRLLAVGAVGAAAATGHGGGFLKHEIDRHRWLLDVVLTDLDADGRLDVATTNHAMEPRLLIHRGGFGFETWDQSAAITRTGGRVRIGWGGSTDGNENAGLSVTREGVWIRLDGRGLEPTDKRFVFLLPPESDPASVALVDPAGGVRNEDRGVSFGRPYLAFGFDGDFSVAIAPSDGSWQLDGHLLLPDSAYPGMVTLGADGEPFGGWVLDLSSRDAYFDWHGTVWTDVDGDGRSDVYVNQGGFGGRALDHSRVFNDLLVLSSGGAHDAAWASGIRSRGRPGRGVQPIDVDRNGLVDLYVVNGRRGELRRESPNALHMQTKPLRFRDEAETRGLSFPGDGHALWIDADLDGWVDLAWGDHSGVRLFRNVDGTFVEAGGPFGSLGEWGSPVSDMSAADFDKDGDLDIAVSQRPESFVLRNDGGAFTVVPFSELGLPPKCWGVAWVDYDLDGRTDLFTQPGGLFRRGPDGGFEATGLVTDTGKWEPFAWGDLDLDGLPDLVRAAERETDWEHETTGTDGQAVIASQAPAYTLAAFENQIEPLGHWLQIDLVGPPGNAHAVGATVLVEWDGAQEIAMVGQSNVSGASMGLYRLAFGLGRPTSETTDTPRARLTVRWSDGTTQQVEGVGVDRLITVRHPSSADG